MKFVCFFFLILDFYGQHQSVKKLMTCFFIYYFIINIKGNDSNFKAEAIVNYTCRMCI